MTKWLPLLLAALLMAPAALLADEYDDRRLSDAKNELKIKSELLTKVGWDMIDVDVTCIGDRVILEGEADSKANQELAKEVAYSIDGVDRVTNHIRVKDDADKKKKMKEKDAERTPVADEVSDAVGNAELEVKDAILESRVKTQLIQEMGFNAFQIEVEAADGVVSLRGDLDSKDEIRMAKKLAGDVKGVGKVVDLLKVEKD